MAKSTGRRVYQMIFLAAICAGAAMLGFALKSSGTVSAKSDRSSFATQDKDVKVIDIQQPDDLLEFGNLRVKNRKLVPGRKFSAAVQAETAGGLPEEWLDGLEFSLKNKSDKPITYILFELQFPDTEANGPLMVYRQLAIGVPPGKGGIASSQSTPLSLESGNSLTFRLSPKDLQMIKDFLSLGKFQLTDITKVTVKVLYVTFDDGMKWSGGDYFRPDPRAPGGYERTSKINR